VAPVIEPWDCQPNEPPRAWAAFCTYRDLEPHQRSLVKVGDQYGRTHGWMEKLSSRWRWVGRVRAWDIQQDRIKRAAAGKALEDMARRQVGIGLLMQKKAADRLSKMTDDEVALLSVWELTRLAETGVKLERIGRGEPIDIDQGATVVIEHQPSILEFLRANPERIGPVVEALAALRAAVPELAQPNRAGLIEDDEELPSSA
jgi:hypothetical protein